MELLTILREGVARGASDIHLKVFSAPVFRIAGRLIRWEEAGAISREDMAVLCQSLLDDFHLQRLKEHLQVDAGFGHPDLGRFRVNVFYQRGDIQAGLLADRGHALHPTPEAVYHRRP